jgi:hypothetical protein
MADNKHMKEIVSGMIDRDTLIRWTLEAKDREIETLKIANGIFTGRIEELEQLADEAAWFMKKYHGVIESLQGLAFATQEPNLAAIETWQEQYRRLEGKK